MITKVNIVFTYRSDSHKGKDLHRVGGFIHARSGFKRNRTYKGRTFGYHSTVWSQRGRCHAPSSGHQWAHKFAGERVMSCNHWDPRGGGLGYTMEWYPYTSPSYWIHFLLWVKKKNTSKTSVAIFQKMLWVKPSLGCSFSLIIYCTRLCIFMCVYTSFI